MRKLRLREGDLPKVTQLVDGGGGRGWLRWDSNQGVWCKTHSFCYSLLCTLTVCESSTSFAVCTAGSCFIHSYRHWDVFAPHHNPNTSGFLSLDHLMPHQSFSNFSLSRYLHAFSLWTIYISSSQPCAPIFLIKEARVFTQKHIPVYCGAKSLKW